MSKLEVVKCGSHSWEGKMKCTNARQEIISKAAALQNRINVHL